MLEQKNRGATIIFSTHLMEQVEKLCDSLCLINEGKSVLEGELRAVKKNFRRNSIRMAFDGQAQFLNDKTLVEKFKTIDNCAEIFPADDKAINDILQATIKEVDVTRFEVMEPSLNEIFIETVTKKKELRSE